MTGFSSKKTLSLFAHGRGKSVWPRIIADLIQPDMQILTQAQVDEKTWYTVKLSIPAAEWLRTQDNSLWYEFVATNNWASNGTFDIEESLFTVLSLKWK